MPVDKPFLTMLNIGDIIVYKMRPEDLPVNPDDARPIQFVHIIDAAIANLLLLRSVERA